MALITYGAIVSDIRGSVGDVVYTRCHAGPMVRAKSTKPWVDSDRRALVRLNLSHAHMLWTNTLTPAQRQLWEQYAAATPLPGRLGKPVQMPGYAMFARSLTLRLYAGDGPETATPSEPGLPPVPGLAGASAEMGFSSVAIALSLLATWYITTGTIGFVTFSQEQNTTRITQQSHQLLSTTFLAGSPGNSLPDQPYAAYPFAPLGYESGKTIYVHLQVLWPDNRLSQRQTIRTNVV